MNTETTNRNLSTADLVERTREGRTPATTRENRDPDAVRPTEQRDAESLRSTEERDAGAIRSGEQREAQARREAETTREAERREPNGLAGAHEASPEGDAAHPLAALFSAEHADDFRERWRHVQTSFVDDPSQAVRKADELVAEVISNLAATFAQERAKLEGAVQGEAGGSTENLRVALQRYRSFFERLLSL